MIGESAKMMTDHQKPSEILSELSYALNVLSKTYGKHWYYFYDLVQMATTKKDEFNKR